MNTELIKDNLNTNTNKIVEEEDLKQSFYDDCSSNEEDLESVINDIDNLALEEFFKPIDHHDFNLDNDLNNGHIYLIKNKLNGKCYVGQAMCFQSSNNNRWGTWGRWLSHIREALNSNQDHCVILNSAIRKYGQNSFEVFTLKKCPISEMNEHERFFIEKFNSMQPRGYNIREGGSKGKLSDTTVEKMKKSHLGIRRTKYNRKNQEDNDLPKYIKAYRVYGVLKGYAINKFPIGVESCEYIKDIYFTISKYKGKDSALAAAIEHLNKLKEEYKHINEEVFKDKSEEKKPISLSEKRENKFNDKLPENIFAIIENAKITGYIVDGIINHDGISFPKKEFSGKTNRYNLNDAKKFVEQLLHIKNNKIIVLDINKIEVSGKKGKVTNDNYYLPMYVNCVYEEDTLKGFVINGFPSPYQKCGKFKKIFVDENLSLDDLYKNCIQYLDDIKTNPELMKPSRNQKS